MSDDDLAARLRAADPAANLAPLASDRVSRLLETTMTTTTLKKPPHRGRLIAVAAALVAVAAAGVGVALSSQAESRPPTVTRLVNAGATAKCVPTSAEVLAAAPLAFEGKVERIDRGVVTLEVAHQYAGSATELVEVSQSDGAGEALIGATVFEPGGTYLIAASDGHALVCGYSGLATPELRALYDEAF